MTPFDDMQVLVGNVSGTPAQHISTLRAEGVCEAAIRYAVAHAIDRYLDGQRADETSVTNEQYVACSYAVCEAMKETAA